MQGTTITIDGSEIGCIQSIGTMAETRPVTKYSCMSSDDSTSALGGIERSSLDIGVFLDPDDATGQGALEAAFRTNAEVQAIIELSDSLGTNGTQYEFTSQVSGYNITIEKDQAVMASFTLEINSSYTITAAA